MRWRTAQGRTGWSAELKQGLTLLGWGLTYVAPLDLPTALLSGVPGGASTMSIVAHDLGGDMRLVAALHLTRQLIVFILVPLVLSRLLRGRLRGYVDRYESP